MATTTGPVSVATNPTLSIALVNQTTSNTVYGYITGQAINNNNALFLLQSDGQTPYYPASPSANGTPLAVNCSIALGAPGSTTTVTIPQIAGGRIWFCVNDTLTFLLNPGPGLVEPSSSNPSDPNYNKTWDFCEFTFNSTQLFANISYVDFVSLPIALTLTNTSGGTQHVSGIPANGLTTVCNALTAQNQIDNAGWSQLIVNGPSGSPLRAVSPNTGIVMNSSLFSGYYSSYVNQVWSHYASTPLTVDTQAQWGAPTASVVNGLLTFQGVGTFAQPAAADIFSCSTGPFAAAATNTAEMGAIGARLAAAFNRSTLLIDADQPDGEVVSNYYSTSPTNHYARILHATNLDGRGYAFPYDDVGPSNGADQSGSVSDGSPQLWTVTVGGANASASAAAPVENVKAPVKRTFVSRLTSRFGLWRKIRGQRA
ncbi:glycoside hydrolase family 64 protein [Oidiodendron maius Zn]|uniref:Glycoside hydrolase family 64 protein n=1 Tax=Oidiodendron maius (strain Zn) TaxID=913774 RepID=A0A0C3H5V9_OIDMZ|nr:glycoside hydrolase family 64 protein [Oidiodendron maius Zn]